MVYAKASPSDLEEMPDLNFRSFIYLIKRDQRVVKVEAEKPLWRFFQLTYELMAWTRVVAVELGSGYSL